MEGNWFLDSTSLGSKCDIYIGILNQDISECTKASQCFKAISSSGGFEGDSFDTYKYQLADAYVAIKMLIDADNQDISDCNSLKGIANKDFDGDQISKTYNKAKEEAEKCRQEANDYWNAAKEFTYVKNGLYNAPFVPATIPNVSMALAIHFEAIVDQYEEIMQMCEAKWNEYNAINAATATMFSEGQKIRFAANALFMNMNQAYAKGEYAGPFSSMSLIQRACSSFGDVKFGKEIYNLKMREFIKKYPEFAQMIKMQGDIYELRALIENSKDYAAVNERSKELSRKLVKLNKLFYENYYIFDQKGNILGNHLEEWDKQGKNDLVSFFANVYDNDYYDLTHLDCTSGYRKLSAADSIRILEKNRQNATSSFEIEQIEKEIERLKTILGQNENTYIVFVEPPKSNQKVPLREFLSCCGSFLCLTNGIAGIKNCYITRETAEKAFDIIWDECRGSSYTKTWSIEGSVAASNIMGLSTSIDFITDLEGNLSIEFSYVNPSVSFGTSMGEDVISSHLGVSQTFWFVDNYQKIPSNTLLAGGSMSFKIGPVPCSISGDAVFDMDNNTSLAGISSGFGVDAAKLFEAGFEAHIEVDSSIDNISKVIFTKNYKEAVLNACFSEN